MVVPILQGPLRGGRWIVGSSPHGCWLGSYELPKQSALAQYVRKGDAVCDIGANAGFYTLLLSKLVGEDGQVFAFEPVPRNLKYLRRHVGLNRLRNVAVFDIAVSNTVGKAAFEPTGCSSTGCLSASGRLTVRVETLDSLFSNNIHALPRLLKIDVEGAEADVLLGGRNMLARHRPVVFLATHGPAAHQACCEILFSNGYRIDCVPGATPDELIAVPSERS